MGLKRPISRGAKKTVGGPGWKMEENSAAVCIMWRERGCGCFG